MWDEQLPVTPLPAGGDAPACRWAAGNPRHAGNRHLPGVTQSSCQRKFQANGKRFRFQQARRGKKPAPQRGIREGRSALTSPGTNGHLTQWLALSSWSGSHPRKSGPWSVHLS